MKLWPLLIVILLLTFVNVPNNNLRATGAATTQSTLIILGPSGPVAPGGGAPSKTPSAGAGVAQIGEEKFLYIGDFAEQRSFTIWLGLGETWYFVYKNANHTITPIEITLNTAKFEILSKPIYVKLQIGQEKQIDIDQNYIPDIKLKVNEISGSKVNLTMEIPAETLIMTKYVYKTPEGYYLLLLILLIATIHLLLKKNKRKLRKL